MKIAVASFEYEGNSLSPKIDGHATFARYALHEGPAIRPAMEGARVALAGGIATLEEDGATVHPVLMAKGGAGGRVDDAFFTETRDRIVQGIATLLPLDGVYLALHGAMITAAVEDPEGDLLTRLRAAIGPAIPVAVSLDLHANVTPVMVREATIIVGYETYPHVDAFETGARAAGLLARTVRGEIRPAMALRRIRALTPVLGGSTLGDAPMAQVMAGARQLEASGAALSVSAFPIQPWLDIPDGWNAAVAIADGDATAARSAATATVTAMWERRAAMLVPTLEPDDAVAAALAHAAPHVVLVDSSDSIGGGAAGDSPALLAALAARGAGTLAAVSLVDPAAVEAARKAGEGARLTLDLGAGLDGRFHRPVTAEVTVERLCDGAFTYEGGPVAGVTARPGPCAVLRLGEVRVLAASHAAYEHMDEHYRAAGIEPRALKLATYKNLMNFNKLLGPGTGCVIAGGPGATPPRLEEVPWTRRQRPFWPCDAFDEPPFAE